MPASKGETKQKKNTSVSGAPGGKGPPQFVKYRLTDDELAQARNAVAAAGDIEEIIDQIVGEGYKVSIAQDKYGGGIQVFMTQVPPGGANAGWTLTARAPVLSLAVAILAWKHYTLFSQDWPKDTTNTKGEAWG